MNEYMREQIELCGASGARYRFRRIAELELLPGAGGNFVYTKTVAGREVVVACGTSETLSSAGEFWPKVTQRHGADAIYVRLNVSRACRQAEHEDIAQAQPSADTLTA